MTSTATSPFSSFNVLKMLCAVAFIAGMVTPQLASAGENEDNRKMTRLLNSSVALKYVATGIEKQYDVKCRAYELESLEDDLFVATAVCIDSNARKEEASGVILTIDGTKMNEAPLLLSNIKIHFAG